MTSLVTSTSLVPLDSFRNGHVTSGTRTGVGRGTKEHRTLMGIGTFVIDGPCDKQLPFRKNLQDYQEQHRGVIKPQVNQLPVVPFRLSNPRKGEEQVKSGKRKADDVIGQLLPLLQQMTSDHQRYCTYSSPYLSSSDSLAVRNEGERGLEYDGCFPSLTVDTSELVADVLQKRRVAHAQQKNQDVDSCMEKESPMAQSEVSETERWSRLQTLNCSLTTGLTHKLSFHRETTRLKPRSAFESSGPSSKDHVMATKTKLLGDLIQAGNMVGPRKATQTSQLAVGYNKRNRIPRMGEERRCPVWSPHVLDRDWIDLVNIQLVDYDDYDRFASRRRPSVCRGNRCNVLQPNATLGQEMDEEVGKKLNKGVGQELGEGVVQELDEGGQELCERVGQELDKGLGQELDERVGQESDEEESYREMVQYSFGKYSSKS